MIKLTLLFVLLSAIAACQSQEIKPTVNTAYSSEDNFILQEYIVKPVNGLSSKELQSILNTIGSYFSIKHEMSGGSFLVVYNGRSDLAQDQFDKLNNHDQIQFASLNGVKR